MTELFTKKIEGTIIDSEGREDSVEVTVTNDLTYIHEGEFVCVNYFSEQFCKFVEWTLDEEPTTEEIAEMISKKESRTVVF